LLFGGAPFNCYPNSPDLSIDATQPCCPVGSGKPPTPPDKEMGIPVPIAEILDGTSNTMMVGEVVQGRGTDLRGFSWWGGASGFVTFIGPNSRQPDVVTGGLCNSPTPHPLNPPCITTSTNTLPRMMGSRSRHPGGVQVSFCDGHTTFIKNTISINLWRAISTSRGSEALNALP
jgi:prepilin-type processing-associated H-X9-DG protein